MRLGISSYTYTWAIGVPGKVPDTPMTEFDLLNRAHDLGVKVVQYADNLPLDRCSTADLDRLVKCASNLGISIEIGTRGIDEAHLRHYLGLAQQVSSPFVRTVFDTATHHPDEFEIVAVLRRIMPEFERSHIQLAIENHDRFPVKTMARIVNQLGSDAIGFCLDTVNSFGALEGPDVVLAALGDRVINLHVKDFRVYRVSHMMGFVVEGTPAGQGQLNVPWLIRELSARGRDPNAILELWTPPDALLNDTIQKEAHWATDSIHYLRDLIPV